MHKTTWLVTLSMLLVLGVSRAEAQIINWTDRAFVNVNYGGQKQSLDFDTTKTFPLYRETATLKARYGIDSGGLFDISGGIRVGPTGGIWHNVGVGIGFSRFQDPDDITVEGTFPHPVFFDRPRSVAASTTDVQHSQSAVHIFGLWMYPVSDKIDVAFFGGPTIFSARQDLVTDVQLAPEQPPFTATITSVVQTEAKKSGVGVNVGADLTYMVTPLLGGGVFLRYSGGSVDLDAEGVKVSLDVGGFQVGAGLRVRFQRLFP
jgi:hypothetical protein